MELKTFTQCEQALKEKRNIKKESWKNKYVLFNGTSYLLAERISENKLLVNIYTPEKNDEAVWKIL
jgi:hypothetical protein